MNYLKFIECWFNKKHIFATFWDGKSKTATYKCVRCGKEQK